LKELNGEDGYSGYTEWMQKVFAVFAFNDHFKLKNAHYILSATCSDEEIDYIYSLFKGEVGHPAFRIAENPEMIKAERPELFGRLKSFRARSDKCSEPVRGNRLPPES